MRLVTPIQMRDLENRSEELGVSKARLMANAGAKLAEVIAEKCNAAYERERESRKIVFLAGSGNNGGDCFVAAKKLWEQRFRVTVVCFCGKPSTQLSQAEFDKLEKTGVYIIKAYSEHAMNAKVQAAEIEFMTSSEDENPLEQIQNDEKHRIESVIKAISGADIVVDGIFGTGFHGSLDSEIADFLTMDTNAYRIAVDVPSGGNCETGEAAEGTFKADCTVVFGALKAGMTQFPLKEYCGEIISADIGIPEETYNLLSSEENTYMSTDVHELINSLKERHPNSHKGNFGRVLCIVGSSSMRGAASLCTLAALRSGAGLVTLASVEKAVDAAAVLAPEATFCQLKADANGYMCFSGNTAVLKEYMDKSDAVVIGCGMGFTEDTVKLTRFVIENANCPVVIDADGINCVASDINMISKKKAGLILTPHPGEMARLLNSNTKEVNNYRFSASEEFAKYYDVVAVLKGASSVTADATRTAVNLTGNAGMSCGGSGDVLAGIIASLVAQGYPLFDAARFGACLHGKAGDIAAEKLGQEFMLPRDIIDALSDFYVERRQIVEKRKNRQKEN